MFKIDFYLLFYAILIVEVMDMNELKANITVIMKGHDLDRTVYLSDYKKDSVFENMDFDFGFKIIEISENYAIIELNESDRFKLSENKINLKNIIKVEDLSDEPIDISIRLDSIE